MNTNNVFRFVPASITEWDVYILEPWELLVVHHHVPNETLGFPVDTIVIVEVKLICEEFYSGSQQLFTYWSNNGILRLIKKCKIELYADDNFEMLRLMCLFYNAKCCYENNKRGVFAYFS